MVQSFSNLVGYFISSVFLYILLYIIIWYIGYWFITSPPWPVKQSQAGDVKNLFCYVNYWLAANLMLRSGSAEELWHPASLFNLFFFLLATLRGSFSVCCVWTQCTPLMGALACARVIKIWRFYWLLLDSHDSQGCRVCWACYTFWASPSRAKPSPTALLAFWCCPPAVHCRNANIWFVFLFICISLRFKILCEHSFRF